MQKHNSRPIKPTREGWFYLGLVEAVYRDIAGDYSVSQSVQRIELSYLSHRFETEGLSFLTKTLPRLGKAIDLALAKGTAFSLEGFKRHSECTAPKLFGWLTTLVFNDTDGLERPEASPVALKHLRQLCYLCYKLRLPYDSSSTQKVLDLFIDTDEDLKNYKEICWTHPYIKGARNIVTSIFSMVDPRDIKPRHGPGAVSTGETTTEKGTFSRIYRALEAKYPFTEYFVYSMSHVVDELEVIQSLKVEEEACAKVVLVPKDSRGPRLISCEPLEIQWIQQGLGPLLESAICRHKLTAGFVNFTDQTINGNLALAASKDQQWVTLDMKDASDRVSVELINSLFQDCPDLRAAMHACRSTRTKLPCGHYRKLEKFAPMGSRLCFPLEAICFYVLIASALMVEKRLKRREVRGRIFIYGDDIIMRREDYPIALQALPQFGLKFNEAKCCTSGFFRESCGVDAFKGVNVTPTRMSHVWSFRKAPDSLASYVSLRNALIGRGYIEASSYVECSLGHVYGPIPYTEKFTVTGNGSFVSLAGGPAYAAVAYSSDMNRIVGIRTRMSPQHQRQVYSYCVRPIKARAREDSWSGMLRRHSDGFGNSGGVYALPRRNCLKRGWINI